MINRRRFVFATGAGLLMVASVGQDVHSQVSPKRVGYLAVSRGADRALRVSQVFVDAMREHGWVEGRNIVFEFRWSDERNDRLPVLAADLVRLNVDVIVVASGATGTKAAKDASPTIPIVMGLTADPVKFGLVASLAKPGGNVTGLALPPAEWGKWLELAREGVPGATRMAVIANSTNIVYADYADQNAKAAHKLGLQLQMYPVASAQEFGDAFAAMKRERADVLIVGPDTLFNSNIPRITDLARSKRLPLVATNRRYAELGAIITFGTDIDYVFRRCAEYVDKILRGAKPAELPVEQPERTELIINLKTARELEINVPRSLIVRADEVIQ